ncbi:unnamed protein product, partial [Amoebophrya sp. A25]|eukprot:GSA25T00025733001.1
MERPEEEQKQEDYTVGAGAGPGQHHPSNKARTAAETHHASTEQWMSSWWNSQQ